MPPLSDQEYEERKAALAARFAQPIARVLPLAAPQAFLIDRAVPRRAITFLSGPRGGAKSWLAYDLTMSVAREIPWLGRAYHQPPEENRGVLVLNYDNPTPLMAQRFVQLGAEPTDRIWFHTLPIDTFEEPQRFASEEQIEVLRMIASELKPALILIDSFRQACDIDENDSAEVGRMMRAFRSLTVLGASVVILHHTTKAGGELRGSGELGGSADAIIDIAGADDERFATWTKTRGWTMPMMDHQVKFELRDSGAGEALRTRIEVIG